MSSQNINFFLFEHHLFHYFLLVDGPGPSSHLKTCSSENSPMRTKDLTIWSVFERGEKRVLEISDFGKGFEKKYGV